MKYLLDTDVISQYRKVPPNPVVDAWIERTDDTDLYISDITIAELWYGVHLMPTGKRRTAIQEWIENDLPMQFFDRVIPFAGESALHYARLMARAKKRGHNAGVLDGMVAAIAVANSMTVATLNRRDFEKLGVETVDF